MNTNTVHLKCFFNKNIFKVQHLPIQKTADSKLLAVQVEFMVIY